MRETPKIKQRKRAYICKPERIADHPKTCCHNGKNTTKTVVHQKYGKREAPNKTEKLGKNHVRGGLQQNVKGLKWGL